MKANISDSASKNSSIPSSIPKYKKEISSAIKALSAKVADDNQKAFKRKRTSDLISGYKGKILALQKEINQRKLFLQISEVYATKIQKLVRGFLVRIKMSEEVLKIRRASLCCSIRLIEKNDFRLLMNVGSKALKATIIIQKFARRTLFLLKIRRIQKVYQILISSAQKLAEEKIKTAIRSYHSSLLLKDLKFRKYRNRRLREIRRKLAILSFKNFCASNGLTFAKIKRKIKRYRRVLKTVECETNPSYRNQSTRNSEAFNLSSNENILYNDLGNILECASLTSTEYQILEDQRRERLHWGKIAYNIPKQKDLSSILPFLYEKTIKESVIPKSNILNLTNSSISRSLDIEVRRQVPKQTILKKKLFPRLNKQKRFVVFNDDESPGFTRPTFSSSLDESIHAEFRGKKRNTALIEAVMRDGSTVLNQTFSRYQKMEYHQRAKSNNRGSDSVNSREVDLRIRIRSNSIY